MLPIRRSTPIPSDAYRSAVNHVQSTRGPSLIAALPGCLVTLGRASSHILGSELRIAPGAVGVARLSLHLRCGGDRNSSANQLDAGFEPVMGNLYRSSVGVLSRDSRLLRTVPGQRWVRIRRPTCAWVAARPASTALLRYAEALAGTSST